MWDQVTLPICSQAARAEAPSPLLTPDETETETQTETTHHSWSQHLKKARKEREANMNKAAPSRPRDVPKLKSLPLGGQC